MIYKKKKLQNFVYLLNRANHCGIYITELYIEITQPFLNLEEASLLAEMFGGSDFWLETRVIIKISKKMIPNMKPKVFFIRKNKTKFFFFEKKIQNGRLKKTSFCQTVNSQYFFAKLSRMGPWVNRIDWCEGHWFGSICVVVRLSDISSKMAKKHQKSTFSLF